LRSNLCHRNESNKFYFKPPSPNVMEVRMQPNITWKKNILYIRILLSDGLLEIQAQIGVITVIVVSDSEDDNDDDNKK